MEETYEEQQRRLKLEMDAVFSGQNIETMTEEDILRMELSYALMGEGNLSIEERMRIPEYIALYEYIGRHCLDDETPEEMELNDRLYEEIKKEREIGGETNR